MSFPGRDRYGRHSTMRAQGGTRAQYSGIIPIVRHSVDMNNCLESFPNLSIDINEFLINKPRPAIPATAAKPVFILKIAFVTPLSPRFNELNARLVLSFAFMSNCNLFLAIIF